jgi:hypothetical protein
MKINYAFDFPEGAEGDPCQALEKALVFMTTVVMNHNKDSELYPQCLDEGYVLLNSAGWSIKVTGVEP